MLKKKIKLITLMSIAVLLSISVITQSVQCHSPKYVDAFFYLDEQVLSVYYTHGVSNTSYHYISTVNVKFYDLGPTFLGRFSEGDKIEEHDVIEEDLTLLANFTEIYTKQEDDTEDTQDTQIFHHNYTITDYLNFTVGYWTYIRVTAHCNLYGNFTHSIIAGQIWYDIEHSMIEAVVPTLICAVVILTPLVIWAIIGKRKQQRETEVTVK